MSFDNYYPNRKDWRKPYRDGRRFDSWLRAHQRKSWRRLHNSRKRLLAADEQLRAWKAGETPGDAPLFA